MFIICVQTIRDVFRVKRCLYLSDVTVEASVWCAVERSHFWRGEARGKNFTRLLRKFYESNNEDNSGTASSNSSNHPINIININVLCTCTLSIWTNCYVFSIILWYAQSSHNFKQNQIVAKWHQYSACLAVAGYNARRWKQSKQSPASRIWPQLVIAPSNHTILSQVRQH